MRFPFLLTESRQLLGTYLRPHRGRVMLLATLLLASIALQLANPQILRYFIDATQRQGDLAPLIYAGFAYIALSVIGRLLTIATTYLSIDIGWRATNALRADL